LPHPPFLAPNVRRSAPKSTRRRQRNPRPTRDQTLLCVPYLDAKPCPRSPLEASLLRRHLSPAHPKLWYAPCVLTIGETASFLLPRMEGRGGSGRRITSEGNFGVVSGEFRGLQPGGGPFGVCPPHPLLGGLSRMGGRPAVGVGSRVGRRL